MEYRMSIKIICLWIWHMAVTKNWASFLFKLCFSWSITLQAQLIAIYSLYEGSFDYSELPATSRCWQSQHLLTESCFIMSHIYRSQSAAGEWRVQEWCEQQSWEENEAEGCFCFICPKLRLSETLKWHIYIYNFLGGEGKHTPLLLKSESCRYVMLVESRNLFMPHCFTESVTSEQVNNGFENKCKSTETLDTVQKVQTGLPLGIQLVKIENSISKSQAEKPHQRSQCSFIWSE